MTDRLKKILIVGGVIIAIFLTVSFFGNVDNTEGVAESVESVTESEATRNAVVTLRKIELIEVDMDVFFTNVFRSLTDFGREIFPEPISKQNPFARIN